MKSIYIDTNILLAAHMPDDPFFESSRKIYTKLGADYVGYTSSLSLVEIAGVVSGRMKDFQLELLTDKVRGSLKGLSLREMTRFIAYRILSKEGLNIFDSEPLMLTTLQLPTTLSTSTTNLSPS